MFILIFVVYTIILLFYKAFCTILEISGSIVDIPIIIMQAIVFYILYRLWKKRENLEELKENIKESSLRPLRERKTYMKIQYWIMLILIFFFSTDQFIDKTFYYYISQIMVYALMIMFAYPIVYESYIGMKKNKIYKIILLAVFGYILGIFIEAGISGLLSFVEGLPSTSGNQEEIVRMIHLEPLKNFIDIVFAAAITEELVFRGLFFRTLLHRNRILAYIVTFLIFGLVHMPVGLIENGLIELWFLPVYGMSGLINAWLYEKTETIFTPMISHGLNNLIGYISILFL